MQYWLVLLQVLMMAYDTKIRYSFLCFNLYNDLDAMTNSKYTDALRNTFPTVDLGGLFQSSSAWRNNPRAAFWQLDLYALRTK